MTKDNGGNAFPAHYHDIPGMTLRDWFAGQALAGLLSTQKTTLVAWESMALRSYGLADAMLKEREK